MAFWSSENSNPKRNYKFKISLVGLSNAATNQSDVIWFAKTVTLPSFDVSNAEVHHFDNRYYFPGRVTWNPVSMTLTDPVSPDAAAMTAKLLEFMGYQVPLTQENKKATLDRKSFIGKITVKIEVFDFSMSQAPVESWTLNNAFVESAKWGDLAYDNDDLKQIDISFRYDWADMIAGGNSGNASTSALLGAADAPAVQPLSANQASSNPTATGGAGQTGLGDALTEPASPEPTPSEGPDPALNP